MELRVRPKFVSFLGFWLGLSCVVGLVVPLWMILGNAETYSINGAPAARDEFLEYSRALLPWLMSLAILSGLTSWAILGERPLGRPLAIALILLFATGSGLVPAPGNPPLSAVWPVELALVIALGLPLWWYFYRKRNVVEYYHDLRRAVENRTT